MRAGYDKKAHGSFSQYKRALYNAAATTNGLSWRRLLRMFLNTVNSPQKMLKTYSPIRNAKIVNITRRMQDHNFMLSEFKLSKGWNKDVLKLIKDLGSKIFDDIGEPRSTVFLKQGV